MNFKFSTLLAIFSLTTLIAAAQTDQTKKKSDKDKIAEARSNAAKADATLQKSDIYDKDVLDKKTDDEQTRVKHSKRIHVRTRFHKRKLNHRLRRRR